MSARRYLLEKRVLVNGKTSHINLDNYLDLREYIALVALGSTSSATPLTFSNGLSKDAFNVATLGGTLTSNATITTGAFDFETIGSGSNSFRTINGDLDTIINTTPNSVVLSSTDNSTVDFSSITVTTIGTVYIAVSNAINIDGLASYDDEADAIAGGLSAGDMYQTTGLGAAPLDVAGILMIKL